MSFFFYSFNRLYSNNFFRSTFAPDDFQNYSIISGNFKIHSPLGGLILKLNDAHGNENTDNVLYFPLDKEWPQVRSSLPGKCTIPNEFLTVT